MGIFYLAQRKGRLGIPQMIKRFVDYKLKAVLSAGFHLCRGLGGVEEEGHTFFLTPSILKNDK
jgi:hypothetical protein